MRFRRAELQAGIIFLAVGSLALQPAPALSAGAQATTSDSPELLRYRWHLEGLQGFLAWLVRRVPTSGDGVMTTTPEGAGRVRYEFRATSPKAAEDEHWTYSSELDLSGPRTVRVVDSIKFRGKERQKIYELEQHDVFDLLTGLHMLRHTMPAEEQQTIIWSDRKLYKVRLIPGGLVARRVNGRQRILRHFTLRPVREPGVRDWNARAEVWFAVEEPMAPVEIHYRRMLGQVRLELQD